MSHVLLIPVCVPAFLAALGPGVELRLLALSLFASGSVYEQLYTWAAPTAASVVIANMGLRSGEKVKGAVGGWPEKSVARQAVTAAGGLLDRVKALLGR